MSGGERTAPDRDSSCARPRREPRLDRQREVATDGGTRRHSPEDNGEGSAEERRDHAEGTDCDVSSRAESTRTTGPDRPRTDDSGREHNSGSDWSEPSEEYRRPLAERSHREIEREIEGLEQNLEQYETRDQAVIDRYEGLLAERRHRERQAQADQERGYRQRLRRLKNRALRMLGLR